MFRLFYSEYWRYVVATFIFVTCVVFASTVFAVSSLLTAVADQMVRYALAFVYVQVATILLLSCSLVLVKQIMIRREQQRAHRIEGICQALTDYVAGGLDSSHLLHLSKQHPRDFLDVFENSLQWLKGPSRENLEKMFLQSTAYSVLLKQRSDKNPNRAIRAISLLRKLGSPEALAAVEKALSHSVPIVRLSARIAILNGADQAAQERTLRDLPQFPFWQRAILFQQVSLQLESLPQILGELIQSGHDEQILTALEFIISRKRLLPVPDAQHLACTENAEIRIKYFKALPFLLADGSQTEALKAGLADPDWRVRAMAAKASGQTRTIQVLPELVELLQGAKTSVEASHAAQALATLGDQGRRHLHALSSAVPERVHRIISEAIERDILLGESHP